MAEWNAPEYSRINSLQEWMADEQLKHVELAGSERVLDVGCGDGKVTAKIAARLPQGSIVGVDPSHSMIAYATEHYGPPHAANSRFQVGDARLLGFAAEFDLVVSFNALHWVLDQQAALSSIRAALKPGGRALLRMVSKGDRQSIEAVVDETRGEPRWASCFGGFRAPFVHFTPEEYRGLATKCGLAVEKSKWRTEPGTSRRGMRSRRGAAPALSPGSPDSPRKTGPPSSTRSSIATTRSQGTHPTNTSSSSTRCRSLCAAPTRHDRIARPVWLACSWSTSIRASRREAISRSGSENKMTVYKAAECRRIIFASLVGTTIEFYDFYIYATAAVSVFPLLFFASGKGSTALLASMATFGVAFVARPLGSVVFGHFGDRIGRKATLVGSLLLMGLATFAIGFLPTYHRIGIFAPTLLAVLRFCQGLGLGGEWSGAALLGDRNGRTGPPRLGGDVAAARCRRSVSCSRTDFSCCWPSAFNSTRRTSRSMTVSDLGLANSLSRSRSSWSCWDSTSASSCTKRPSSPARSSAAKRSNRRSSKSFAAISNS